MFGPAPGNQLSREDSILQRIGQLPQRQNTQYSLASMFPGQQMGSLPGVKADSKAPSYDLNTPAGLNNPMLQATLQSGNAGGMLTGVKAFLGDAFNPVKETTNTQLSNPTGPTYEWQGVPQMLELARNTGYQGKFSNPNELYQGLNEHLKDYATIKGMSSGWDGKNDPRGGATTMYRNVGGVLQPITDPQLKHIPRSGGVLRQNPLLGTALTAMAGILTGGLALGAAPAAGAAAGSAGASSSGTLAGAAANGLGYGAQYASLPAWAQGAANGALQGGLNAATSGRGNGLGAMFTGALSGGLAPMAGSLSAGSSMPSWASQGLQGAARGGIGAALGGGNIGRGALGGGLSGLGGSFGNQLGGRAGSIAGRNLASLFMNRR
jgi:hypothetical protein